MPVYEYICLSCEGRFERYVRSWGESVTCPACQSGRVEKQLSTFALAGTESRSASATASAGCGCGRGGCGCH